MGQTELWARSLRSAIKLRPDKRLIIGCTDNKNMLERLKPYFKDAELLLVKDYGVSIHLRY